MRRKLVIVVPTIVVILIADVWTKLWAVRELVGQPRELFGGFLPLTLAYNKGAAFGISVGDDSRWLFVPITIAAVVILAVLVKHARPGDHLRLWSVSFVLAGALGNLYDRVRWDRGVVDFLGPIDLGFRHFPIFNVADASITCGAIALAISFWRDDVARSRQARQEGMEAEENGEGNGEAHGANGEKPACCTSEREVD